MTAAERDPLGRPNGRRRLDPLALVSSITGAAAHLLSLLSTTLAAVGSASGAFELITIGGLVSTVVIALLGLTSLGTGIAALYRLRRADAAAAPAGEMTPPVGEGAPLTPDDRSLASRSLANRSLDGAMIAGAGTALGATAMLIVLEAAAYSVVFSVFGWL